MKKVCLLLFISGSLYSFVKMEVEGPVHELKMENVNNMKDTIWAEGKIIKVSFKNKKDAASKTVDEYRFKMGKKEYFIKYCEGKIKQEDLIPYVGKKLKIQGEFKTGLFDVCPGDNQQDVQSRAGEYAVIFSLKSIEM